MVETSETLLTLINASGFLFQLRVEHEIQATKGSRKGNWKVVAREHRWVDPTDGGEGFIDLILLSGIGRMIVECKRVTDANWVFLVPEPGNLTDRSQLLWTFKSVIGKSISGWGEFSFSPRTAESTFCSVRGQGEKDSPMLERLASNLLRSVESLASEELNFIDRSDVGARIYLPVIITNATLYTCSFDTSKVDIATGKVDEAEFTEVSCIRFRKNLSSGIYSEKPFADINSANLRQERTVFIISSKNLAITLGDWQLHMDYTTTPWRQY